MEPVEEPGPKRGLKAAKEPLSLRFLLAFSASTVLTAAVAVPMAFQAHLAREDQRMAVVERPRVAVLGTTTVPGHDHPVVPSDGLVLTSGGSAPLHDAQVTPADATAPGALRLEEADVDRVDLVLDDGPVHTVEAEPFALPPEALDGLAAGEHVLTATLHFSDGHVELRRARFTVTG